MTAVPTRPLPLTRPAAYISLAADIRRAARHGLSGDRAAAIVALNRWWCTPEGAAFRAEVLTYNAAARVFNAHLRAQLAARTVQAETARTTATIRATRCPRCFTVPAASGVCNCE